MKVNKIAPFEGELVWLGEMRQGVSQKGREWQSIDFVIKYNDGKYERQLNIQAFGAEKVGLLMSTPIGTRLRVEWEPDSHEYNGRWYTKASALDIKVVEQEEQEAPKKETSLPPGSPAYNPQPAEENASDGDLPF